MTAIPAQAILTISDLETLKVISDPLRLQIFQTVSDYNQNGTLCSVKQIADALDIPQAKLYYHIKLLENHELLLIAETRIVSGIVEKLYHVRAYKLMVAENLFTSEAGKQAFLPMFSDMVNDVQAEMQSILSKPQAAAQQENFAIARHTIRLPAHKVKEFSSKFELLLKEIEQQETEGTDAIAERYTFFYVFYPQQKARGGETIDSD